MTCCMSKVILGGMLANMCVDSHRREWVEQGFEVVVKDATAAARHPEWGDGYQAAPVPARFSPLRSCQRALS